MKGLVLTEVTWVMLFEVEKCDIFITKAGGVCE